MTVVLGIKKHIILVRTQNKNLLFSEKVDLFQV